MSVQKVGSEAIQQHATTYSPINEKLIVLMGKFSTIFSKMIASTRETEFLAHQSVQRHASSKNSITFTQGVISTLQAFGGLATLTAVKPEIYTSLLEGAGKASHLFSQHYGDGYELSKTLAERDLQKQSQEISQLLNWVKDLTSTANEALRHGK